MKKIITSFFLIIPIIVTAQSSQGIIFTTYQNWEQVLERAKVENKNIFLDAYATWCVPCKKMDQEVYSKFIVGNYFNNNFISVKVQFDRTEKDNVAVRKWYTSVKNLTKKYHIDAFPTLLFFDKDGNLLDRESGYQNTEQLLALSKKAIDSKKSYYQLVRAYKNKTLPPIEVLNLSLIAKKNKDDSLALEIAKKYKLDILDKLNFDTLIPAHIDYFSQFSKLFTARDSIIKYLYRHQFTADRGVKSPGFAKNFTDYIISADLINSKILKDDETVIGDPDWKSLEHLLSNDYDSITARRIMINTKLRYYNKKKDWNNIAKYNIEKVDFENIDTTGMAQYLLNNMVFNVIFQHATDPEALKKGIQYMEIILKNRPDEYFWIDTYANLLYKVGNKKEAIKQQEKALNLAINAKNKESIKLYRETIQKMKTNQPTWE